MSDRNFMQLLQARWNMGLSVCVGLDSDIERLPGPIAAHRDAQLEFNMRIVDATCALVCAYKPNLAFYSSSYGFEMLRQTILYINDQYPTIPVILDAKQADIGNTNAGYVLEDFTFFGADAVTVHNYLGMEAMKPFLDQKDKGTIVLCRTSNPGAGEFQDLQVDIGEDVATEWGLATRHVRVGDDDELVVWPRLPLYQVVAQRIARDWNYNGNCAVVVGATYPDELAEIRKIVGDMPILIPGIGAQGGELEATVKAGANSKKQGMIINNARGIIFASSGKDYAEAARAATQKMHDDVSEVLAA